MCPVILRDYQRKAVEDVLSDTSPACVVAPCGAGKTIIGVSIVAKAGRRAAWVVHRHELADQARGKLSGGAEVMTVQGCLSAGTDMSKFGLIVFDECHHYQSDQWRTLLPSSFTGRVVGLTATPERADGRPLGDTYKRLVVAATYETLLQHGHICDVQVYAPADRVSKCSMQPEAAWRRWGQGKTIMFLPTVEEARSVADLVGGKCVDGGTPGSVRADTVAAFREGTVTCLTNVHVLTEGFDVPDVDTVILARGIDHPSTFLQISGRATRTAPGKSHGVLVDLFGVVHEHGWPTSNREYSLSGTPISKNTDKPLWQCKFCGMVYRDRPSNGKCPACGKTLPKPKALVVKERRVERLRKDAEMSKEQREAELERLKRVAKFKGYSPGWAWHVWNGRFGNK